MNSKVFSTLATIAVAVASAAAMSGAFAVEATQYTPEAGSAGRADVKADAAKGNANVVQYGEATVFVDRASNLTRSAAARAADEDRGVTVVRLGEATQFIDQPGTRSRADVRAETLAALNKARHP